jgi:tRNA threonylcarbamoyladenosine biosynthesis protein TsaB
VTLTLAVETSTINYGVALCSDRGVIAHQTLRHDDPAFTGLGGLALSVLSSAGHAFGDVDSLTVDIGPGNLGSVRVGVAYVNGLAFSLGRPIFAADCLTLLAREARATPDQAVLCLRNAGSGNVYAGLFQDGRRPVRRHGPLDRVVPELAGGLPEVLVAGSFRADAREALTGVAVKDTGIDHPSVLTLCELLMDASGDRSPVTVASPLNDSSPLFHAPA